MDKRVLIVDDERTVLEVLSRALVTDGWEILNSQNPMKAIDVFNDFHPNLVITDLALDNHIDGATMADRMHRKDPMCVFLAVSGHLGAFNLGYLLGAVFTDVFQKPISLKEIQKAAEYAWEKRQRWESYLL
jgi:DNA-binding NtrC family response regulator